MSEDLEERVLYLAATRPALFMGVPLPVAAFFMIGCGMMLVLFKNPFYLLLIIPAWIGARFVVARDYNAANVLLLWLRTAGRSVDSGVWGGATVSPNPIKTPVRGRGLI